MTSNFVIVTLNYGHCTLHIPNVMLMTSLILGAAPAPLSDVKLKMSSKQCSTLHLLNLPRMTRKGPLQPPDALCIAFRLLPARVWR